MKKLFLLAVSLAALWGCEKSEIQNTSPQEALVTTKAANIVAYINISIPSTPPYGMQANISFTMAIPETLWVSFTVNNIYVDQGGWENYTSATLQATIRNGGGDSASVPARKGEYSYMDISSLSVYPNLSSQYNIIWVVNGLPTSEPGPSYCSGCGHIEGSCPSSCTCSCQGGGSSETYCCSSCGHVEGSCTWDCSCGCQGADSMRRSVPQLK